MRTLILVAILLGGVITSFGQSTGRQLPCDLSTAELHGLHLRMTVSEVHRLFPSWRQARADRPDVTLRAPKSGRGSLWKNIRSFNIRFLDDKVYWVTAIYLHSFIWTDPDQFASSVARSLRLPDGWKRSGDHFRALRCGNDAIVAGLEIDPSVTLVDGSALAIQDARHLNMQNLLDEMIEADRKTRRGTFKP